MEAVYAGICSSTEFNQTIAFAFVDLLTIESDVGFIESLLNSCFDEAVAKFIQVFDAYQ